MRAVVREAYGPPDVVHVAEVPKPTPRKNEVLIRVAAASINGSDREGVVGSPAYSRLAGVRRPRHKILGSDVAGRVEQVGSLIRDLRVGDEVVGEMPGYHSGFAEYVCAPESAFIPKPAALTFEQAAAIPQGGAIALQGIRLKAQVRPGQRVLINGAAGAAGSFAVQLAKLDGAEVTAVDHGEKEAFLRSLGADHVIDYTTKDFTQTEDQYDLILDTIGHHSVAAYVRVLRRNGTYLFTGGATRVLLGVLVLGSWFRRRTGKNVRLLVVPQDQNVLRAVTDLCAQGQISPAIDQTFALSEGPEALRYVIEGRQEGKVVITVD